mmetsp:Transcript_13194/g.32202  ORF Transcript_13194/g.32202 Transcript_13194/m.32202 type:complete len:876 (+) Transcript_13194:195-2822(+)
MKINSLISRFETPPSPPEGKAPISEEFVVDVDGDGKDPKQFEMQKASSVSILAPTNLTVEDSIIAYNLTKTPTKDRTRPQLPQSSENSPNSPGRMRKALQKIRLGGGHGAVDKLPINSAGLDGKDEGNDDIHEEEQDDHATPLSNRVDDVIKSITERSSHHPRNSNLQSSSTHTTEETSVSSGSDHDGKNHHNDISWSQHSDRTHVTDNKTVKSQNQTIPENIYENGSTRTLDSLVSLPSPSSSRPNYKYYDKSKKIKKQKSPKTRSKKIGSVNEDGHNSQYGEYNLSGSGMCAPVEEVDEEEDEEPFETELQKRKSFRRTTRSRSRSTDGNRTEKKTPGTEVGAVDSTPTTPRRRLSRRMSPGALSRRRLSSKNLGDDDEVDHPKPSSESNLEEPKRGSFKLRKPQRSMSAGRLSKTAGRSTRKERSARSQSPGDERRKPRSSRSQSPGDERRKPRSSRNEETQDDKGDGGKDITFDPFDTEDPSASGEADLAEDKESSRILRSRGRSPGKLRGGTKTDRKKTTKSGDSKLSSSRRSSSRESGLRRSRSRTGRSSSPGKVRRSKSSEGVKSSSSSKVRSRSSDKDRTRSKSPSKTKSKSSNEKDRSRSSSPKKVRSRSKSTEKPRERSSSPSKKGSREKDRSRSSSPKKVRSKSSDKQRERSSSPGKLRSRSREVGRTRSTSPSKLRKERSGRSKSPGTLRKNSIRSVASESVHSEASSTKEKKSSRARQGADTGVQPPPTLLPNRLSPISPALRKKKVAGQEVLSPRRKSSLKVKTSARDIDIPEQTVVSKPRSRSPGALARPAKTLRATQVKKSQSLQIPGVSVNLAASESNLMSGVTSSVRRKLSLRPPSTRDGERRNKPQRNNSAASAMI